RHAACALSSEFAVTLRCDPGLLSRRSLEGTTTFVAILRGPLRGHLRMTVLLRPQFLPPQIEIVAQQFRLSGPAHRPALKNHSTVGQRKRQIELRSDDHHG